jgi:hypothetical protein
MAGLTIFTFANKYIHAHKGKWSLLHTCYIILNLRLSLKGDYMCNIYATERKCLKGCVLPILGGGVDKCTLRLSFIKNVPPNRTMRSGIANQSKK